MFNCTSVVEESKNGKPTKFKKAWTISVDLWYFSFDIVMTKRVSLVETD